MLHTSNARAAGSRAGALPGSQLGKQRRARVLATPAGVRARRAMSMLLGVLLALRGASPACLHAGLHNCARDREVLARTTGQDPSRRIAQVRAVEVRSNARLQRSDGVFGQAGIGARDARLGAHDAFLDARRQIFAVDGTDRLRVRFEHAHGLRHSASFHVEVIDCAPWVSRESGSQPVMRRVGDAGRSAARDVFRAYGWVFRNRQRSGRKRGRVEQRDDQHTA